MEIKDIITLTQAGFTKDEIMNFYSGTAPAQAPAQAPDLAQAPAQAPAPATAPEPTQVQSGDKGLEVTTGAVASENAAVLEAINKLTATIQASNIVNSRQAGGTGETVDDILKAIALPYDNKPKGGKQ